MRKKSLSFSKNFPKNNGKNRKSQYVFCIFLHFCAMKNKDIGSGWVFRKHATLYCLAEAEWEENRLKAERALRGAKRRSNLSNRERRATLEGESEAVPPPSSRWGKSGLLSLHSAGAI